MKKKCKNKRAIKHVKLIDKTNISIVFMGGGEPFFRQHWWGIRGGQNKKIIEVNLFLFKNFEEMNIIFMYKKLLRNGTFTRFTKK